MYPAAPEPSPSSFLSKRNQMNAPEPLAIWNKKLEGLESLSLEKLKISSEDMYPVAPEHIFGFF